MLPLWSQLCSRQGLRWLRSETANAVRRLLPCAVLPRRRDVGTAGSAVEEAGTGWSAGLLVSNVCFAALCGLR